MSKGSFVALSSGTKNKHACIGEACGNISNQCCITRWVTRPLSHPMSCASRKRVAISNYQHRYILDTLMHQSAQTTPRFFCEALMSTQVKPLSLQIHHCANPRHNCCHLRRAVTMPPKPLSGDAIARQDFFQTHRSSRSTSASAAPMVN